MGSSPNNSLSRQAWEQLGTELTYDQWLKQEEARLSTDEVQAEVDSSTTKSMEEFANSDLGRATGQTVVGTYKLGRTINRLAMLSNPVTAIAAIAAIVAEDAIEDAMEESLVEEVDIDVEDEPGVEADSAFAQDLEAEMEGKIDEYADQEKEAFNKEKPSRKRASSEGSSDAQNSNTKGAESTAQKVQDSALDYLQAMDYAARRVKEVEGKSDAVKSEVYDSLENILREQRAELVENYIKAAIELGCDPDEAQQRAEIMADIIADMANEAAQLGVPLQEYAQSMTEYDMQQRMQDRLEELNERIEGQDQQIDAPAQGEQLQVDAPVQGPEPSRLADSMSIDDAALDYLNSLEYSYERAQEVSGRDEEARQRSADSMQQIVDQDRADFIQSYIEASVEDGMSVEQAAQQAEAMADVLVDLSQEAKEKGVPVKDYVGQLNEQDLRDRLESKIADRDGHEMEQEVSSGRSGGERLQPEQQRQGEKRSRDQNNGVLDGMSPEGANAAKKIKGDMKEAGTRGGEHVVGTSQIHGPSPTPVNQAAMATQKGGRE